MFRRCDIVLRAATRASQQMRSTALRTFSSAPSATAVYGEAGKPGSVLFSFQIYFFILNGHMWVLDQLMTQALPVCVNYTKTWKFVPGVIYFLSQKQTIRLLYDFGCQKQNRWKRSRKMMAPSSAATTCTTASTRILRRRYFCLILLTSILVEKT